jgi:hypothetical protein
MVCVQKLQNVAQEFAHALSDHNISVKPSLPLSDDETYEDSEVAVHQDPVGPASTGALHFQVEGVGCLVYEGEHIQGKKHGHGVLTWPNGRQYKGQYVNDNFHGEGAMTWPDGNSYVGHYANGKKEGEGILLTPDGSKFIGQFHQGKRHGQFTYTKPDGTEKLLRFEMDKLCDDDTCNSSVAKSECTTNVSTSQSGHSSLSSTSSFDNQLLKRLEKEKRERRAGPTPQNPQRWRVIDYGGVVVRASSSLKSKKLGTTRQNAELVVVGASGRRLCVANPLEGCATGWVSKSTEEGLVVMERIDGKEQSERTACSNQTKSERSMQPTPSLTERLLAKLSSTRR